MKVSDYVVEFLNFHGVRTVFTLAGGGCIHLMNSLNNSGLGYISMLHEQGAAIAAEAYAQYNNYLGAAIVTTGPGGTNAITAVASAWLDSVPLMIISGQVQRKDMVLESGVRQRGFQELNLPEIVKSITKYAVTVMNPDDIVYEMDKALEIATTGRKGPVWIEIPLDVQASEFVDTVKEVKTNKYYISCDFTEITDAFEKSKKPILLLGAGAKDCNREVLYQIINNLKIPVLTTWRAADLIDEDNYYFVGRPGMVGQRAANIIQQQADFVLSIGARLDCGQTAFNLDNFAPKAVKFVVDIDPNELNKHSTRFKINMSAEDFVNEYICFTHQIGDETFPPRHHSAWRTKTKEIKEKYSLEKESKGIPIYDFLIGLTNNAPEDAIIVPGSSGAAAELTLQTWKVKKEQRIINSPGLGSMGFAIPQAIGAYFAGQQKPVICIDGDGSFPMNVQELEVIKRFNLPIKIFVLNNDGYGSIRNTQDKFFKGTYVGSDYGSGLTLPSIQKIAQSFGIKTRCFSSDLFENGIPWRDIFELQQPEIIEILLPKKTEVIHRTQTYQLEDGSFASKPMEDLYPSIPEDELKKVME